MAILEVSTIVQCPIRCRYCPQPTINLAYQGRRLMSYDTFRTALDHCPKDLPVSFAGFGEPFLNPLTREMLAAAHYDRRGIQIYTTGLGMTKKDLEALAAVHPYNIMWHVPDEDMEWFPINKDYMQAMRALMELPNTHAVLHGAPRKGLDWLPEHKLEKHPLHSRAGHVAHLCSAIVRTGPLTCGPAPELDNNLLLPDGRLLVCCMDYGLEHVLGNLTEETWDSLHAGKAYQDLRGRMLSNDGRCRCRRCEQARVTLLPSPTRPKPPLPQGGPALEDR